MKSRGKQLMDLIAKEGLVQIHDEEESWSWSFLDHDIEAKLNKFLEKQADPRLKDAKNEVESLRMELRETRKTLEKAQEEIAELESAQWDDV